MIGVFDSGYGGLTILKEILCELPRYDYLYLGDNARAPYGNRSKETVTAFAEQAMHFLFKKGAHLIIFACNVASAFALRALQEKYLRNPDSLYRGKKILGVIRPVAEDAIPKSKNGKIGVVGTRGTVNSGAFEHELHNLKKNVDVYSMACPLLVPFIEEAWHKKPEAIMILKKYLRPLKSAHIDTLILGCTHYPLMKTDFERVMGNRVAVLDSGKIVARSLKQYLARHPEIESRLLQKRTCTYHTTDDPGRFESFAHDFLGMKVGPVRKVIL